MYRVFGLPPGNYLVGIVGHAALDGGAADERRRRPVGDAAGAGLRHERPRRPRRARRHPLQRRSSDRHWATRPCITRARPIRPRQCTVTLGPAEERTGIDMMMQFVPTARVQGIVTGADGQPVAGAQIGLFPQGRKIVSVDGRPDAGVNRSERPLHDSNRAARASTCSWRDRRTRPAPPVPRVEAARKPTDCWAFNPPNLQIPQAQIRISGGRSTSASPARTSPTSRLTLQPGMTLSGRVVFEGAAPTGRVADLDHPAPRARPGAARWRSSERPRDVSRHVHACRRAPGLVLDVGRARPRRRAARRLQGGW